jgi:hypothetical protein
MCAKLNSSAPLSSLVATSLGLFELGTSAGWCAAVPVISSSTTPGPNGRRSMCTSTTAFAPTAAASRRMRNSAKCRIRLYISEYCVTSPRASVEMPPAMPRPTPSAYATLPITKLTGV